MLGLVAYESDEEDDDIQIEDAKPQQQEAAPSITHGNSKLSSSQVDDESKSSFSKETKETTTTSTTTTTLPVARSPVEAQPVPSRGIDAADANNSASSETDVYGPSLGPAPPPRGTVDADISDTTGANQRDTTDADGEEIEQDPELAQMSPYTRNRTLCRSYTMPTLSADFSIPETPPGSPPRDTAQRFAHFLKLKEKNVHFNSKLAQSTGLRNPNFLDKLMDYVELDQSGDGAGQYASNWRKDLWDPRPKALGVGIPRRKGESFAEALGRLQKEGFEKRQQKDRTAVEFVGSSSSTSASAAGTAAASASSSEAPKQSSTSTSKHHESSSSNAPMSAAERVMIGLDRDSSRNSSAKNTPSRKDGGGGGGNRKDDRNYRERRRRSRSRSRSRDRARYRERDYRR